MCSKRPRNGEIVKCTIFTTIRDTEELRVAVPITGARRELVLLIFYP